MSHRIERVNMLLRQEISTLLARDVKDPRLAGLVSITAVECSMDLRHAKVYVSVLGSQEEKEEALKGLASASGFLHRELRLRLKLRHTPDLRFFPDDSIERGIRLSEVIDDLESQGTSSGGSAHKKAERP
ncbi:MAG: 30S ribosome-binding factor RbfA [Chloroflexi bacterium]|nr:30S ribosome-binding factor RbfA [Chloroflexota bacterium]